MCYKTAYRILLDNLDKKAQDHSSSSGRILLRKCFVQLVVSKFDSKMQRVRFVQATFRRHRVALRACFWRLVMWKWQQVQSVKCLVKVSLMIRLTTLQNCPRRWETGRLHRVRSAEEDGLQCLPFAKGSAGVQSVKLSVTSTLWSRRTALRICLEKSQRRWKQGKFGMCASRTPVCNVSCSQMAVPAVA